MKLVTCGCLNVKIHIKNSDLKSVEPSAVGMWLLIRFVIIPVDKIKVKVINEQNTKKITWYFIIPFHLRPVNDVIIVPMWEGGGRQKW